MTDEELRRFDALLCNGPLSRERGRELVAEVRWLSAEVRTLHRGYVDLHAMLPGTMDVWTKVNALRVDRDHWRSARETAMAAGSLLKEQNAELRAENERLRIVESQLRDVVEARNGACDAYEVEIAGLRARLDDVLLKDRGKTQEINVLTGETRELRASLADAVGSVMLERDGLRAELDATRLSAADRTALATAAHELKERRNNYAAMLARCTTATDEFVVTAYREGIAACEAAIAAVERLGGKR